MKWLSIGLITLFPSLVLGQDPEGLVTCSGPDCNLCSFVDMVNGLVDWLFGFLVLAAVLGLMITGFKMVVSGGNESAWTQAKSMFTNIIIGFVIVLSAWLIVDTILKAFIDSDSGFGMWNKIEDCGGILNRVAPTASDDSEGLYCYSTVGGGPTCVYGLETCQSNRATAIENGYQVDSCKVSSAGSGR
jgi:hypothetical protein